MFSHSSPLRSSGSTQHLDHFSLPRGQLRAPCYESQHCARVASSPLSGSGTAFCLSLDDSNDPFFPKKPLEPLLSTIRPQRSSHPKDSESSTPMNTKKNPFMFEKCARSLSPSAKLNNQIEGNREQRKKNFLQGVSGRRQGRKDERLDEQILRTDYFRNIKEWEQRISREEIPGPILPDEEDVSMVDETRPLEEQEIEQLLGYLEEEYNHSDAFSDDDYEQIFMKLSTDADMDQDML